MSLTDLQIRKMKPPERGQKTVFDPATKNFGVRISQGGAKTFIVLLGGERKRKSLGRYPDISLSEARILAKQAQVEFAVRSPGTQRHLADIPFLEARSSFLEDCDIRNKPSTAGEYRRLLTKYFNFSEPNRKRS